MSISVVFIFSYDSVSNLISNVIKIYLFQNTKKLGKWINLYKILFQSYSFYHIYIYLISVTPPLECLPNSDPKGALYFGTQNVAESGDLCQRWDSQSPHEHRYSSIGDQDNYCRNPDNIRGPWCYTVNPDKRWAYCHIPKC